MNFVYPIVLLFYAAILFGVLGGLGCLYIVARKRKWLIVKNLSLLALCGVVVAMFWTSDKPPEMAPGYPHLTATPDDADLVGSYSLSPEALQRLRNERLAGSDSKLVLKADHTFATTGFEPYWPSGTGTWMSQEIYGRPKWAVTCQFRDQGGSRNPHPPIPVFGFEIAAKTDEHLQYALGYELDGGDLGYLIFLRTDPASPP